ncbi:IPT/TIG domain-containing protein [Streptomyces sp. WMMC500]|uniref:IPT/TIG domain-containing protein n=1 Tax=Streptomyces sp. WMMC500 TaxID=3015154 RepID=UPI00248AA3CA|nr:IPT/TIG domain-containing protein [Streptomyces sp. WMMC500]WBB59066.1 IPT/TIG domain-containing protein [Streptomyces sp. WMMC500]
MKTSAPSTRATSQAPLPPQVTMTLAALAATAATPRPSGETVAEQAARARRGIVQQLANSPIVSGWHLLWLALSPDHAHLVYVAHNTDGSNQIAVVVRGTAGSPADMVEDLDVGTLVAFAPAGGAELLPVSAGAMAAFTRVVTARGATGPAAATPAGGDGPTLTEELATFLESAPTSPQPTVCVIGHSLGGCVATMLAPYLQAWDWPANPPRFGLVTYAAPTAGGKSFADYVDSLPWVPYERHVNAYDLVPAAWCDLRTALDWYPAPGPPATDEVKELLRAIDGLRRGTVYVQPSADNPLTVNPHYETHDPALVNKTTADFLRQVAYQHADATYLALLGAPPVPGGPTVTGLSPTTGQRGTKVALTGSGFDADTTVDFGTVPCTDFSVDSATGITAYAPDGAGLADIRVTNLLGTSPAAPAARFAYGPSSPVAITAISPNRGGADTVVTVDGTGFTPDARVLFRNHPAAHVDHESSTRLTARAPRHLPTDPATMDITIATGVATSPTGPYDEFTYGD